MFLATSCLDLRSLLCSKIQGALPGLFYPEGSAGLPAVYQDRTLQARQIRGENCLCQNVCTLFIHDWF